MYKLGNNFEKKNNDSLTSQLIDYIYSNCELSKFKFELIQYDNDLPKLLSHKYFVTLNFVGFNNLLVFCKIRDKFYTFVVERQTLSYSKAKVNLNEVRIYYKRIFLDPSVYNGTIFDGTLVKGKGGQETFIISDVYQFCGSDYTQMNLDIKLTSVIEYLKVHYNQDDTRNSMTLSISKVFPIEKTTQVVTKMIPAIKDFKIRGLSFFPATSGTKLLFFFDNDKRSEKTEGNDNQQQRFDYTKFNNQKEKKIENIPKVTTDKKEKESVENNSEIQLKYVNKTDKPVYATLEMKSTDEIDVYKLFAVEKANVKGKTFLKRVKMGNAYIKGINKSLEIRTLINSKEDKKALMKCLFNEDKNKWEPVEEDKKSKFPTYLSEIEEKLELVEAD
uniref:Uncharacterized protein n=1 Tax=viral metagenome TaxID=1070528 RepID=A0A6C0EBG7_9ZZZZ